MLDKNKRYLAFGLAIVMITALVSVLWPGGLFSSKPTMVLAADLQMEATKADSAGADLDTYFRISSGSPIDARLIQDRLQVEPEMSFAVKKGSGDSEVLVVPGEPLEPKKVYKFTLSPEEQPPLRWAFQTKGEFNVVSTLPGDKSGGVPLYTGIEVTLSHLDYENFEDYFSIEPKVEGTFEFHKKTAVFLPQELQPTTIYTVTVKQGLPLADSSEKLEEDFVFQFETQEKQIPQGYRLNFYKYVYEYTPDDKPLFQTHYYGWWSDYSFPEEAEFSIYKYKDANHYIDALKQRQSIPYWAYNCREHYREDVSDLEKVGELTLPTREYDYMRYYEFPESFSPGYYVVEGDFNNDHRQFWFQVTELGLYATVTDNRSLIWVNNLTDGTPVKGAQVKVTDGDTVKTDGSGLALFDTPQQLGDGVYAVVTEGAREAVAAVVPFGYFDNEEWKELTKIREAYWKYFYLDRSLYKPEDTVHFWGLAAPRDAKEKIPEGRVTVQLSTAVWGYGATVESVPVVFDDFTFTGSIKLPKLSPGYYNLNLMIDDKVLSNQYFEVQTYTKPLYRLDVAADKRAIMVGDTVNFDIEATFFEGTPAANMPFNHYIDDKSATITTDTLGKARLPYTPVFKEGSRWSSMRGLYLYLSARLPEGAEINGDARVTVLNNDVDVKTAVKAENDVVTIDSEWYKLTADKVNSGEVEPWDKDAYKEGPAPNRPVEVKVFREIWDKVEAGKYYDFINKKVETRYQYNYRKELELESEYTTDGDGLGTYSFEVEPETSYIVQFTMTDYKGNPSIKETWVCGSRYYREQEYPWYHLESSKSPGVYQEDEAVTLLMKNSDSPLAPRTGGFLFYTARQGLLETTVQDSPEFNTVFQKDLIPNFWAGGVYFDGRYYHESSLTLLMFDSQEKALKLTIETDKQEYRPKDTVKVQVDVRDKDGKPVEAKVNVNLVDEALYALSDQYANLLGTLYNDTISSGIIGTLITHEPERDMGGGAEHGGEGGSERKDFKDAVFFKTLTTDKQGKASASFDVPDNLTSWRLTGQAITRDLSAATSTSAVVVRLPFFVDMVLNDHYLTGDVVTVPLRSYGTELKSGAEVEYEVSLMLIQDDGALGNVLNTSDTAILPLGAKEYRSNLTGEAFTPEYVTLPSLKAGKYELKVTGKAGDLEDTLVLGFTAVDTLMTQKQLDFRLLEKGLAILGSDNGMTRLTFSDYQRSQYLEMLWRLMWADGQRMDQKIAPMAAGRLLKEYFPDDADIPDEDKEDLLGFQRDNGGLSLLPYSDADLELSVKAAYLLGDALDKAALGNYLYQIAEDSKETRERGIIALCGLAALDEPVLQELLIMSKETDLTIKESLYITLALLEMGDEPSARKGLNFILANHGEDFETMLRIKFGEDQDDMLEATALAAVIAAGLGHDEQNRLQAYVMANRTTDILLYLEQLMFLERVLPRLPEEAVSFIYSLEGKTNKIELKPWESHVLLLSPEKLASLKFDATKGQVGVLVSYQKPFEAPNDLGADGAEVRRSYEVGGKFTDTFKSTDLVKVNISFQFAGTAPDGVYAITDFLPAGLKPVSKPYYNMLWDPSLRFPIEVEGQKLVFAVDKNSPPFHYYARVINPGEFKAEPATMSHIKSGKMYCITKDGRVSIK